MPTPDPDPGSGGPTDPAPSWPAQRLPLCVGLPPSILGARPGEGDGLSGTSSPTASSESFCARAPHVPRGDSNVHQDGKSPGAGESRAGTGSGGPGPALGLHPARLGGRGWLWGWRGVAALGVTRTHTRAELLQAPGHPCLWLVTSGLCSRTSLQPVRQCLRTEGTQCPHRVPGGPPGVLRESRA